VDLGLTSEQYWNLTPREFGHLRERWQARETREDRRTALIACLIANANRDPQRRSFPFEIDDFMPGGPKPQTVAQQIATARIITSQWIAKEKALGR
jgi:Protein of unknown function (DUF4035)